MNALDWGEIVRLAGAAAGAVFSLIGLVQDRRERRRVANLFAKHCPLPGCACDDCRAARARTATPSLPEYTGSYRTNPRPQPTLSRKTPWLCRHGWHRWARTPVLRGGDYVWCWLKCRRVGCCAADGRWTR